MKKENVQIQPPPVLLFQAPTYRRNTGDFMKYNRMYAGALERQKQQQLEIYCHGCMVNIQLDQVRFQMARRMQE